MGVASRKGHLEQLGIQSEVAVMEAGVASQTPGVQVWLELTCWCDWQGKSDRMFSCEGNAGFIPSLLIAQRIWLGTLFGTWCRQVRWLFGRGVRNRAPTFDKPPFGCGSTPMVPFWGDAHWESGF